ncbi:hypothetical protein NDU88_000825 [Pleurodeles waltl]|uniref:Uncharacterized protein n=1 Tax=Pleurodeles waltl TaxID=8319 RepID=A0AAV7MHY4_PLEWA|nr:hypothetical protein NDU88_000825 [Pleurodeles waltl]
MTRPSSTPGAPSCPEYVTQTLFHRHPIRERLQSKEGILNPYRDVLDDGRQRQHQRKWDIARLTSRGARWKPQQQTVCRTKRQ